MMNNLEMLTSIPNGYIGGGTSVPKPIKNSGYGIGLVLVIFVLSLALIIYNFRSSMDKDECVQANGFEG